MSRRRLPTLPAILTALALMLAACTSTSGSPSATSSEPEATASPSAADSPGASASEGEAIDQVRVRMEGSRFEPAELTISVGTEVAFVNASNLEHTVTEGSEGQPVEDPIVDEEVAVNGTATVTFGEPGTYDITCRFHPEMQLTVTVTG